MNLKLWIPVFILAVITGIGVAAFRIKNVDTNPAFRNYGSWRGTTDMPLNRNNLVTTQATLFALFILPSQEAVYLFASEDESNNRLNGSSSYVIEGNINNIKAGYWSITAYGSDLYLMPNDAERYSFNRDNLKTDSHGNFKITLSSKKAGDNWLPIIKDKNFELVLRIYDGAEDYMQHLDKAALPAIKRT